MNDDLTDAFLYASSALTAALKVSPEILHGEPSPEPALQQLLREQMERAKRQMEEELLRDACFTYGYSNAAPPPRRGDVSTKGDGVYTVIDGECVDISDQFRRPLPSPSNGN